jgi:hypothetical protein
MHLDVTSEARPDTTRARYETLDALAAAARSADRRLTGEK